MARLQAASLLFVLLNLCLLPAGLKAQVTTATLYGNVMDSGGAVVPQATVSIKNLATNITTTVTTNGSGQYRFDLVPVGTYSVTVSADGFEKFVQASVPLTVNAQARVDAQLTVGQVDQTVTITAEPPQLNLESGVVDRTLEAREVNNLPILDRNIYNLMTLIPGVQANTGGNTLGYNQQVVQMNGGTTSNNNGTVSYYLDGGLNMTAVRNTGNDMPNPEALDEFNVQTSNYNATYGRMSSGVVNALTKSGTNSFHGSIYEFNRNTDFNAGNSYYAGGGNPPFHRNMYGAVIGGPIRRDRTFFFAEFGGVRQITPFNFTGGATLPTAAQMAGDFSANLPAGALATAKCGGTATAFVVCNPTTHKPYTKDGTHASNIITSPLDTTAVNIMNYLKGFENATNNAGLPTYVGQEGQPVNTYEFLGKIDHQISAQQRLEGSYFYVNGFRQIPAGSPSVPWVAQSQSWTQNVANLSDTYTLNARQINQAWFTFTRILGGRLNSTNAGQSKRESLSAFGSNLAVQGPASLSQITVTGYFTLANTIDGPKAGTDFYSARDLFTWNAGTHALSLGGEFSLNKDILLTDLNNYGVFGFSASTTARTGNALADFVLGQANSTSQDAPVPAIDNSFFYAGFAQDDWRFRPNLTFNLGVRWDVQTAPTDPQNKESTFIAGQQSTVNPAMPLGVLVVGDKGVPRGTVNNQYTHFSPRAGFAWDPYGKGRTSLRASAGIFWGAVSGNEWNASSNFYPFSLRYTFPSPGTLTNPYLNTPSVFPYVYTPGQVKPIVVGGSVEGAVPGFKWPRTYQLAASVQQQMTKSLALSVGYVGSLARNISLNVDENYPVFNAANPASNTTGTNLLNRRPIDTGTLGSVLGVFSNQTSNYNALLVNFSQRVAKGISFSGFYTFSKNIDSNVLNSSGAPEDYNNPAIEKGLNDNDQRNVFSTSIVWEPNYVNQGNRVLSTVVNGWHISGIVSLHSGLPFNITTGSDNNQDGNITDRPNLLPGAQPLPTANRGSRLALSKQYFNPSATVFCGYNPAASTSCAGVGPGGSDGSLPRNRFYGPGFRNIDASLFRDFGLFESMKLQMRAEASNVFNMVNLGQPNATLSGATAGTITSISSRGNMRELQLGARLVF